jgi:hypothetical protein
MDSLEVQYTIQDVQDKLSILSEDIERLIKQNNISVGKDGLLSNKAYQAILNFYSEEKGQPKSDELVYVLNGYKIEVKQRPFFESVNKRISIFKMMR